MGGFCITASAHVFIVIAPAHPYANQITVYPVCVCVCARASVHACTVISRHLFSFLRNFLLKPSARVLDIVGEMAEAAEAA